MNTNYKRQFIAHVTTKMGVFRFGVRTDPPNQVFILTEQYEDSDDTLLTSEQQAIVASIFQAHQTLALVTDKASITADNVDSATITCNDAVISGDSDLNYEVYASDDSLEFSGTVSVVGGVATFNFSTAVADSYVIRFARQGATDYEDGYIEVEAI